MPQFFVPPESIKNNIFIIKEVKHIKDVLRIKKNDEIKLFNRTGQFSGKITQITNRFLKGVITKKLNHLQKDLKISLYPAISKGKKFEELIKRCCELGVNSIHPIITERTIPKGDFSSKLNRWQKLSLSAAETSFSSYLTEIHLPQNLSTVIKNLENNSINIVAWENEKNLYIHNLIPELKNFKKINVFSGPEGGFCENEIELMKKNNFKVFTLGDLIFRTEFAPIIILIILMYELNFWKI